MNTDFTCRTLIIFFDEKLCILKSLTSFIRSKYLIKRHIINEFISLYWEIKRIILVLQNFRISMYSISISIYLLFISKDLHRKTIFLAIFDLINRHNPTIYRFMNLQWTLISIIIWTSIITKQQPITNHPIKTFLSSLRNLISLFTAYKNIRQVVIKRDP